MKKSNFNEKSKDEMQVVTNDIDIMFDKEENDNLLNDMMEDEKIDSYSFDCEEFEKDLANDSECFSNSRTMFFQEMKKYPLLSEEREGVLVKNLASENEEERKLAKDELTNSNLRLVVSWAYKYKNLGVDLEDLIQEGTIGLITGIEKFDYNKGTKLSTYVSYYIIQAILRYIYNNRRSVRLPIHIIEKINKYKKEKSIFIANHGYEPDNKTMAKILNMKEKDLEELISYISDIVSLDKNVSEDDDITLCEMIEDRNSILQEDYLEKNIIRNQLDKIISKLKPREQQVIRMKFGLYDEEEQTL